MTTLRIVLSVLCLSLAVACDADSTNPGIGTSPSDPTQTDDPVASQTSELRMECVATYQCGTVTAPRECCRCWEMVPCDFGVERCTFCN